MNELLNKFGEKLEILGFPCNQFGHQENGNGEEIINSLKYVRPGNGFETKITFFEKIDVNGAGAHQVYQFLRNALPYPVDDSNSLMTNPQFIIWSPVSRNDVGWNFEKFLITRDGTPFRRYSRNYLTSDIARDIQILIK